MTLLNTTAEFLQGPHFSSIGLEFFIRLFINLAAVYVLLLHIYYPAHRNKDYLFTLALFNLVIFIIAYLLNKVDMTLGFAFGLFAVFTMLRYRTATINTQNMTYLVISIGIALIHAVSPATMAELLVINVLILAVTFILSSNMLIRNEYRKIVDYEKIDLIKPERREELLDDLRKRTGLNIHRIQIGQVDFMRDTARIRIYWYPERDEKKS